MTVKDGDQAEHRHKEKRYRLNQVQPKTAYVGRCLPLLHVDQVTRTINCAFMCVCACIFIFTKNDKLVYPCFYWTRA